VTLAALQRAEALVRARMNPPGHPHPPGRYISTSQLVSRRAADIAHDLASWLHHGVQPRDSVPRYFTFRGDGMADAALRREDGWVSEVRIERPVEGAWPRIGHCDGVLADPVEKCIVVADNKDFRENREWEVEKGMRQCTLYLADLWAETCDGRGVFGRAAWSADQSPWRWPDGYTPGGILLSLTGALPGDVRVHHLTVNDLASARGYYDAKMVAIVESAEANDMRAARQFDLANQDEIWGK
jgi:hypothetical protein